MRRRALVARSGAAGCAELFRALHGDLPVTMRYDSAPAVASAEQRVGGDGRAARRVWPRGERSTCGGGFTGFGPQADDFEVELGGRLARRHASQGQLRSLVLALKLAELMNVEARLGEPPVLLLDDVPSELDPGRRGSAVSSDRSPGLSDDHHGDGARNRSRPFGRDGRRRDFVATSWCAPGAFPRRSSRILTKSLYRPLFTC